MVLQAIEQMMRHQAAQVQATITARSRSGGSGQPCKRIADDAAGVVGRSKRARCPEPGTARGDAVT